MNPHIESRLKAIQQALNVHRQGGTGLPHAVSGSEREHLINDYLAQVLPPLYRFGRGAITDTAGQISGQLEVVMEIPFGPNFPMQGGKERLYIAEAVAAVIEVKSNLSTQWQEMERTIRDVKKLSRDLRQPMHLIPESSPSPINSVDFGLKIPCYAVGYTGHSTLQGLQKRLSATPPDSRPDGVMVIDSGCFIGATASATGVWGLYAFIAELASCVNAIMGTAFPDIYGYGNIIPNQS